MYVCTSLDASNQCTGWLDLQTLTVDPAQVSSFFVAVLMLFVVAWGFRLVLRLLLPKQ